MRPNRLRHGELTALLGALGLLVVLSLEWYEPHARIPAGDHHTTGWASVGFFAAGAAGLAILVCLGWLVATITQESPAVPVAMNVGTVFLGILALLSLAFRLVFQPGLGIGLGNAEVDLLWPAYAGPLLALVMTFGAWRGLADERTDAPYSQPGEIELRPIPE